MKRDVLVPLVVGGLAALALPATGLVARPACLSTPTAFLGVATALVGLALLLVVPWVRRSSPALEAVPTVLVVALPFLAFGVLEAPAPPGAVTLPAPVWGLLAVLAVGMAVVGGRAARPILILVLAVWVADALLATTGAEFLPAAGNPARAPFLVTGGGGDPEPGAPGREERLGWREGAPVPLEPRLSRLGVHGPGPWFAPADRGRVERDQRLVLVVGSPAGTPTERRGATTFVLASIAGVGHALELDAFDAAVVLPGPWTADASAARRWSDDLVAFARRGGLLLGPAPDRDWPGRLGRRLGAAGRGREGDRVAPFGLGHVGRAASEEEVHELLARDDWQPRVRTVFDPPVRFTPRLPAGISPWRDDPRSRLAQGVLLLAYAVVAAALDRLLRGPGPRMIGLALPAAVVLAGLVWTSPEDPGVRAAAFRLDLAGGGGRRIEAVSFSAGPAGWEGAAVWSGGGVVTILGADPTPGGHVRVPAGRTAWLVRETLGFPETSQFRASGEAGLVRRLLRGPVDAGRVRTGWGGPLAIEIPGVDVGPTYELLWK